MESSADSTEMKSSLMKNGLGCIKKDLNRQERYPGSCQEEVVDGGLLRVATDAWYVLNVRNNNNSNAEPLPSEEVKHKFDGIVRPSKSWTCEHYAVVEDKADTSQCVKKVALDRAHATPEINNLCSGNDLSCNAVDSNLLSTCRNTSVIQNQLLLESSDSFIASVCHHKLTGAAAFITPANSFSNHSSVNKSTDNLSYSSGNYYPDELYVIQSALPTNDVENEDDSEKISLQSDDCIYAYRGDGADYESTLGTMNNHSRFTDDETDFLEMDFDPDPLSEAEYARSSGGVGAVEAFGNYMSLDVTNRSPSILADIQENRKLYSSPFHRIIDTVPQKNSSLNSQSSTLKKNFERIVLHLDQIKSGYSASAINGNRRESASLATAIESGTGTEPLAQSLPNSVIATFGHGSQKKKLFRTTSPLRTTGAKPKQINTCLTSSSVSSKNICKSRTSMRDAATNLCSRETFDERNSSCLDFHHHLEDDIEVKALPTLNVNSSAALSILNDETCLDCLEKEFLASTIGKELDPGECPKCRHRRGIHRTIVYSNGHHCLDSVQCPIKFDTFSYEFSDLRDSYNPASINCHKNNFRESFHCKRDQYVIGKPSLYAACSYYHNGEKRTPYGNNLLKDFITEKEAVTLSINNLDDEAIEKALENIHVMYNSDLIKSYFKLDRKFTGTTKKFKNLRDFILHVSRQNNNYPRLRSLIAKATMGQVEVVFKKDPFIKTVEMVPIKVCDILHQWKYCDNLEGLKQLDKRFRESNVLGKIANIIRQAQQRCSQRRPLPEFIMIPQYYTNGSLTLSRKCEELNFRTTH